VSTDARAAHLFPAEEVFRHGYPSTLLAVCGELADSGTDIEDDPRYCHECVRAALRWSVQS
jgi:hypothetical protein